MIIEISVCEKKADLKRIHLRQKRWFLKHSVQKEFLHVNKKAIFRKARMRCFLLYHPFFTCKISKKRPFSCNTIWKHYKPIIVFLFTYRYIKYLHTFWCIKIWKQINKKLLFFSMMNLANVTLFPVMKFKNTINQKSPFLS